MYVAIGCGGWNFGVHAAHINIKKNKQMHMANQLGYGPVAAGQKQKQAKPSQDRANDEAAFLSLDLPCTPPLAVAVAGADELRPSPNGVERWLSFGLFW